MDYKTCSYCGEYYYECHDYDFCVDRCTQILKEEQKHIKDAEIALEKAKVTQSQSWWKVELAVRKMNKK